MPARLDPDTADSVRRDLVIGIRAGDESHRFTPVWAVVVEGRVFIRSWGLSGRGWREAFDENAHGVAHIGGREIPVRAVRTRGAALLDAVDEAYRAKYDTQASARYVTDLNSPPSRATTTELVPE